MNNQYRASWNSFYFAILFIAAVDCEVGDWTDYSECSRPCGRGVMTRERDVIQEPRNGGLECPVLKETTTCSGNRCKSPRHLGISRGRVEEGEEKGPQTREMNVNRH